MGILETCQLFKYFKMYKKSKVDDRIRGRLDDSLFNSYYIEM